MRNVLYGFCLALGLFALGASYAILPLTTSLPPSPDESSNTLFAENFAQYGMLWDTEPLNSVADGVIHPRAVRVVDDLLVPGGFLGLPIIYGGIGRLLGIAVIPFLTPVVALLGILAWWGLVRHLFGARIAFYAAIALAVQPVWWYVASRTMMPNTLFVSLLLGGAYVGIASPFRAMIEKRGLDGLRLLRRVDPAIAGMLVAFALAVRPSEIHWVAFAVLMVAIPALKTAAGRWRVTVFVIAGTFAMAPFLLLQHSVYGSIFSSGYGNGIDVPLGGAMQGRGNALLGPLRPYLFPLGFAPMNVLRNVYSYAIALFPWWTLLVGVGTVVAIRRLRAPSPEQKQFLVAGAAIIAWLMVFYGSWNVNDNPDPSAVTIGESYLRYWLPVVVLSTLLAAYAVDELVARTGERWKTVVAASMLGALALIGALSVVFAAGEGWRAMIEVDRRYARVMADVLDIVPRDSVVIADRADKYFFGERRVMSPLRADSTYDVLPLLVRRGTTYYFGITLPPVDLDHLRTKVLLPRGIGIEPVRTFDAETLYVFAPLSPTVAPRNP